MERVSTIGAYGYDPAGFFGALAAAGIDCFLDVRRRRGMRGSRYAFANSERLQASLAQAGIEYRHVKDLAPDEETRAVQRAADALHGERKSERTGLAPLFVAQYRDSVIEPFDWGALVVSLAGRVSPVVFCVERDPAACHRSLVARRLADEAGVRVVVDLVP